MPGSDLKAYWSLSKPSSVILARLHARKTFGRLPTKRQKSARPAPLTSARKRGVDGSLGSSVTASAGLPRHARRRTATDTATIVAIMLDFICLLRRGNRVADVGIRVDMTGGRE